MKVKIFPEGYDPMVATGPPSSDIVLLNKRNKMNGEPEISWTPEETEKCRQMEANAEAIEVSDKNHAIAGIKFRMNQI